MKITTNYGNIINVIALIDTGANSSNYISQNLFERLRGEGHESQSIKSSVRGGLKLGGHEAVDCKHALSFSLSFHSEISNKLINQLVVAKVLPIDYELIIGLPSVKKWELMKQANTVYILRRK
jgi:hypothetical protein